MTPTKQGSIRLFRLWGIDVHLHWSWFMVALYSISTRLPKYESPAWAVYEYLALFVIVLMHEFGHALACRQVGGQADQIVLWPLGGVAYVNPPARPGATLWSIAAGPLVNVALAPLTAAALYLDSRLGWRTTAPDLDAFVWAVFIMNLSLLCFNLLPVYPLDGGQILRSLLWYPLGKARSLMVSTIIGFVGGAGLIGLALWQRSLWTGLISFFLLSYCWRSFQQARGLRRLEQLPRRTEFACTLCNASPPIGKIWACESCHQRFDAFAADGVCPHCGARLDQTGCVDCGNLQPFPAWSAPEASVERGG